MEIVDIAVKDLIPYDKNPRRNDEAALCVFPSWRARMRAIAIFWTTP